MPSIREIRERHQKRFSHDKIQDGITRCPTNPKPEPEKDCAASMEESKAAVREAESASDDPIEMNRIITQSYRDLSEDMPQNHWLKLAGYVSSQGGCAMRQTQGPLAQTVGRAAVDPEDALAALKDANITIFSSVYPPNKFMQKYGYKRLEQCVSKKEIEVDKDFLKALKMMDDGKLGKAADAIAYHEQVKVVQPVYDRHKEVFDDIVRADDWYQWFKNKVEGNIGTDTGWNNDLLSIPVSHDCARENVVELGELDIRKPPDRVKYYKRLMKRMREVENPVTP